jgi:WD40 repeat protein
VGFPSKEESLWLFSPGSSNYLRLSDEKNSHAHNCCCQVARSLVSLCLFLFVAACASAPAPTAITAYHGHTGPVFGMAWSPDGRSFASGGNDSTVQV